MGWSRAPRNGMGRFLSYDRRLHWKIAWRLPIAIGSLHLACFLNSSFKLMEKQTFEHIIVM